jgi:predicted transcriptional regulator
MLTKQEVQNQVNSMPNEFTLDEFIERLIVIDKINQGLNDVAEGNILTDEEMDKEMAKWFK